MSNPLSIQNVSHNYGKKNVLDNLSLEIEKGESIALLGRNGSGKTSLINMITGLLSPQKGKIEVFGENPAAFTNGYIKGVSFVSEKRGFFPWLTIGENIEFMRNMNPEWEIEEEKKLMDVLRLKYEWKSGNLSKGEKGKLVLLFALATKPELLIMDEPTEGLDPAVRRTFMTQLVDLMLQDGKTVFYSTHEINEAERLAQKIAILNDGKIVINENLNSLKEKHRKIKATLSKDIIPEIPGARNVRRWENKIYMDILNWNSETEKMLRNSGVEELEIQPASLEDIFCMVTEGVE